LEGVIFTALPNKCLGRRVVSRAKWNFAARNLSKVFILRSLNL
jgi:hypothetical protein